MSHKYSQLYSVPFHVTPFWFCAVLFRDARNVCLPLDMFALVITTRLLPPTWCCESATHSQRIRLERFVVAMYHPHKVTRLFTIKYKAHVAHCHSIRISQTTQNTNRTLSLTNCNKTSPSENRMNISIYNKDGWTLTPLLISIYIQYKVWNGIIIKSQTLTVQPLMFVNGLFISSHTLLGMRLLISSWIILIPC